MERTRAEVGAFEVDELLLRHALEAGPGDARQGSTRLPLQDRLGGGVVAVDVGLPETDGREAAEVRPAEASRRPRLDPGAKLVGCGARDKSTSDLKYPNR